MKVYNLELRCWNIYSNGTHPIETTKGFNDALQWASENGYTTFSVPPGEYLIAKGDQGAENSRINLVSDMIFLSSDETIFQKETNGYEIYSLLYVGPNIKNVTIKGGTFRGDRETHDYSQKGPSTSGTHEWGNGIDVVGAENITIDAVKLEKFTGDGIEVKGSTVTGSTITEASVEAGGIDDEGQPVGNTGKIRTKDRKVTNFDNIAYQEHRNIHFWLPEGIVPGSKVDVYYYRADGSFIKVDKQIKYYSGESIIPQGADYFRAVFEAPSIKNFKVTRMTVDISRNVVIKNADIGYNRRQGISLVGSDGVTITNNDIHHIGGVAPGSGIDIEPGFYQGRNTIITDNRFMDNRLQIILAYGENARIEGNTFKQAIKGVGVYSYKEFTGEVTVKNNSFDGSTLTLQSHNAEVIHNQFKNSELKLVGNGSVLDEAELEDTSLSIGSGENQKISNVAIKHNGIVPGVLYLGDTPVHIENLDIQAQTKGKGLIFGQGNNESMYNNLTVADVDKKGTVLPAGTYNNCSFEAGELTINRAGKYTMNDCTVKDTGKLVTVLSTYGKPEVLINKSTLEITGNIGYGAAVYILGAQNVELVDSKVFAINNTYKAPLIKAGPYGAPKPTNVFGFSIKNSEIRTKAGVPVIDTLNAGTDAPPYTIRDNKIYNGTLHLKANDVNVNNQFIQE
ncbi:right-handed parallel beta-helix repeat-containing protein [Domibacillus mangrovi]|uniref:Right handed beta helix domain-containing protein n=1 Tax=Domibacillus mangrovi TaxID=1714354 RepID=A0A1Q5P2U1_9BACI|nr:right-handed parallel beta-helix repeat-containing protein [Domibacillus mangrovi]OKL36569.1 hypothetical protein BLL40_07465 [Domibacillus mangrovi]